MQEHLDDRKPMSIDSSKFEEIYNWYQTSQKKTEPGVLYRGVVIDNVDPDGYGRVKVLIESITPAQSKKENAMWAWTLNSVGGGQENDEAWGVFLPYVKGSTVIVGFLQSDYDYGNPVVLGGWYKKNKKPEETYDMKKKGKKIPRAWGWKSPKGHTLEYREEDEEEQIILKSCGGSSKKSRKIVISDKKDKEFIALIGAKGGEINIVEGSEGTKINIFDKNGDSISIDETKGTIAITARETFILTAKNMMLNTPDVMALTSKQITITGTDSLSLLSTKVVGLGCETSTTSIEGNIVKLGSISTMLLDSGGPMTIKGDTVGTVTFGGALSITAPTISLVGMINSMP